MLLVAGRQPALVDGRQMPGLTRGLVGGAVQGPTERLVVRPDRGGPALKHLVEVLDCKKNSHKLTIESTVLSFGGGEFF